MRPDPKVPDDWSPEQALAVHEFLDELRERIWDRYGEQIQEQCRIERSALDDRQLDLFERDDDLPF